MSDNVFSFFTKLVKIADEVNTMKNTILVIFNVKKLYSDDLSKNDEKRRKTKKNWHYLEHTEHTIEHV